MMLLTFSPLFIGDGSFTDKQDEFDKRRKSITFSPLFIGDGSFTGMLFSFPPTTCSAAFQSPLHRGRVIHYPLYSAGNPIGGFQSPLHRGRVIHN